MRPSRLSRSSLPIAAAAFLAAVIVAPVAAVAPGGASDETVTGVFEAIAVDTPGGGPDRYEYTVRRGHDVTRVAFDAGDPQAFAGATVSVTGNRRRWRHAARPIGAPRDRRPRPPAGDGRGAGCVGGRDRQPRGDRRLRDRQRGPGRDRQDARGRDVQLQRPADDPVHQGPAPGRRVQQRVERQGVLRGGVEGPAHDHGNRVRVVPDRRQHGELRLEHLAHPGVERRHGRRREPLRLHARDVRLPEHERLRMGGPRLRPGARTATSTARSACR